MKSKYKTIGYPLKESARPLLYQKHSPDLFPDNVFLGEAPRRSPARSSPFIHNKKAAAGPQSMAWSFFLILALIALGTIVAAGLFFGSGYDFREVDAKVLNYKVSTCVQENEFDFNAGPGEFFQNLFSACHLDQSVIEANYYINIRKGNKEYSIGRSDPTQCELADRNPEYFVCSTSSFIKNSEKITIQTGTDQKASKVIS